MKNEIVFSEFSLIALHIFLVKVSSLLRTVIILVSILQRSRINRMCVCACVHIQWCVYTHMVSSPYLQIRSTNGIHCINTMSFYIRDLSIHGFGIDGGFFILVWERAFLRVVSYDCRGWQVWYLEGWPISWIFQQELMS